MAREARGHAAPCARQRFRPKTAYCLKRDQEADPVLRPFLETFIEKCQKTLRRRVLTMEKSGAKAAAKESFERSRDRIIALSHRIHAHPELRWEEVRACAWICEELSSAGLEVMPGICDLPTAFVARAGGGPLHIAICAEYDCLPEIGHACGHNLIAAMAVGAGIALARVANDLGVTIRVVGTPAEEIGNAAGKVLLLERGGFDGVHAAMMVH